LLFGEATLPTNIPIWSLFFEFAANAVFFTSARRGKKHAGKSLIFLCTTAAILAAVAHLAGGLGAVGENSAPSFLAGFVRVAFSFGAGVAISHFALHRHFPAVVGWVPLLLLVILMAQSVHGWWYDILCTVFCFPLLLRLGARATSSAKQDRLWLFAGALSYPVYVIQEPVLRAIFRLLGPGSQPASLGILATMGLAALLLRIYDEPLRARLALSGALLKSGT
jgi:peptidoglycan/LPS O-acetylase OafA/YrhL